ncbi:MAG: helix-hairpin-helix domain-containing protein [Bacteroidota bacterium]
MANKTSKKSSFQKGVDALKSGISSVHDDVLHTADKMVDVSLESAGKWQKLGSKALNKGTDLLDKQQDIAFNTLEEVKSQYLKGNKRFIKLIGLDRTKAKKAAKLKIDAASKTAKKAIKTVTGKAEKAQDDLKKIQGIGPKVESLLNEAGINSFEQLANTTVKKLEAILEKAGSTFQSMDPSPWKALAKEASKN